MCHRVNLSFLICAAFAAFASGCGKKTAPPPPKARSDLVLSLYSAMEERRHDDALRKIARLREIAPSDVFLANLETLERNNSILRTTQLLVDSGDLKGASEFLSEGMVRCGRHPELMKAKEKLDVANRIDSILRIFEHPPDSDALRRNAETLKKIASKHKSARMFLGYAEAGLKRAAVLRRWERKCAVEGLCSQIASSLEKKDDPASPEAGAEVLYAILEVVDSGNPMLAEYKNYISGKRGASLNVYKEEDIFDSLNQSASTEESPPEEESAKERKETATPKKEETKSGGGWWKKFSF